MTAFESEFRLYMRDGSGLAVVYVGAIFLCVILFDMEMIKQCRELFYVSRVADLMHPDSIDVNSVKEVPGVQHPKGVLNGSVRVTDLS